MWQSCYRSCVYRTCTGQNAKTNKARLGFFGMLGMVPQYSVGYVMSGMSCRVVMSGISGPIKTLLQPSPCSSKGARCGQWFECHAFRRALAPLPTLLLLMSCFHALLFSFSTRWRRLYVMSASPHLISASPQLITASPSSCPLSYVTQFSLRWRCQHRASSGPEEGGAAES